MGTQLQNAGWRRRKVWLGGLVALALSLATLPFSGGGCEMVWYPDGTLLPLSLPWRPATQAGVIAARWLVALADVVGPAAFWLGTSLLIGALWARALRRAWLVWSLVLTPPLAGALHLLVAGLLRADAAKWVFVPSGDYFTRPPPSYPMNASLALIVAGASVTLTVVGALAALVRWAWMQHLRSHDVAVNDVS